MCAKCRLLWPNQVLKANRSIHYSFTNFHSFASDIIFILLSLLFLTPHFVYARQIYYRDLCEFANIIVFVPPSFFVSDFRARARARGNLQKERLKQQKRQKKMRVKFKTMAAIRHEICEDISNKWRARNVSRVCVNRKCMRSSVNVAKRMNSCGGQTFERTGAMKPLDVAGKKLSNKWKWYSRSCKRRKQSFI